jgi:hypothetical protein
MSASPDANLPPPGPVDFSTLILGLSSAALYYLGEATVDGRGAPQKSIPLAKHNIDIMLMLREKTRGNLNADEARLIAQLVSDLQVKLVEAAK